MTTLKQITQDAISSGLPGMAAMSVQVSSLMWLRTTLNYQYRHGGTMSHTMKILYKEGGLLRFYRGYTAAMIQAPISRFGDTAANAAVLTLLQSYDIPIAIKTAGASIAAGTFRIGLMPIDTVKTMMQVGGSNGFKTLHQKLKIQGPSVLYHGSLAASFATFVGHYPWFTTYNYLNFYIPRYSEKSKQLMRNAFIGFWASLVSDICSNSIRVVKTTRQTATQTISYSQVVQEILEKDGYRGLFGRGLQTKILSNGVQGILFSVLWNLGQDYYKMNK
jgi:hypothetical protein